MYVPPVQPDTVTVPPLAAVARSVTATAAVPGIVPDRTGAIPWATVAPTADIRSVDDNAQSHQCSRRQLPPLRLELPPPLLTGNLDERSRQRKASLDQPDRALECARLGGAQCLGLRNFLLRGRDRRHRRIDILVARCSVKRLHGSVGRLDRPRNIPPFRSREVRLLCSRRVVSAGTGSETQRHRAENHRQELVVVDLAKARVFDHLEGIITHYM